MDESLKRLWESLSPDQHGLVAALVVHAQDGRVLMLGYMSVGALAETLRSRRVTFFSRSKRRLWTKGESSGHVLRLHSLRVDCDGDALLIEASPAGPTCHTGTSSCFFTPIDLATLERTGADDGPAGTVARVFQTILARKAGIGMTNAGGRSYVRELLEGGVTAIAEKIREEADELARALVGESDERVANEAADLLFHGLVGLAARDLAPSAVQETLNARHGRSGIDEKAGR